MQKISEDVQKFGWHVLAVSCDSSPSFSYTIGFEESLNHPEVIISGLKIDLMHRLLNKIGTLIKQGRKFKNGDLSDELIKGFPVKFVPVKESELPGFLGLAEAYYDGREFNALQCIWPDKNGVFQTKSNKYQDVLG